jgi:hypothetical protein
MVPDSEQIGAGVAGTIHYTDVRETKVPKRALDRVG